MSPDRLLRLFLAAGTVLAPACGDGDGTTSLPRRGPSVASVTPGPHAVGVDRGAEATVRFAEPVDPGSLNAAAFHVFGRWSGVMPGETTLDETRTELTFTPARPFHPGEQVTVLVSAGALRTPEGEALSPGHAWTYWTAPEPADLSVSQEETIPVRRPGEGRIQTYGAYAGDLDGDGDSDLLVPNERPADLRVFLNDGSGGYSEPTVHPIPGGAVPSTNEGGDFDGDGVIDIAVGNIGNAVVSVFLGVGDGTVRHHRNLDAGEEVRGVCVLDLETDGRPDIVAAAVGGDRVTVFRNEGSGDFTPSAVADVGSGETSCAVADFDEDGLLDVAVGARGDSQLGVLLSDGRGGLRKSWQGSAGGNAWMLGAGDVNGDGHADVVSVSSDRGVMVVFLGDGTGTLSQIAEYAAGGFPLAVDLGDLDGDGDLDVVTSQFQSADFTLFENVGDGSFREAARLPASSAGSCAVLHDRDGDGDLDVTGIDEVDDVLILFGN
ncbi:MAG: hypothetical protein GWM92_11240 [Gemmatimonadetes bacterium]|nr:hypothetical protein [Gemmatimonadota bacterium]NIR79263.1 hypothetical protein [Gemmatimonadota bacterium]NIT87926.1 hypothetical protein [Gemmatimonadota bacterium]NIU31783.1 hypothetical protein [Gemmatimonadota bacterium]NIU36393.1 hypothetical protein [Gemmatimonadota bacterium]